VRPVISFSSSNQPSTLCRPITGCQPSVSDLLVLPVTLNFTYFVDEAVSPTSLRLACCISIAIPLFDWSGTNLSFLKKQDTCFHLRLSGSPPCRIAATSLNFRSVSNGRPFLTLQRMSSYISLATYLAKSKSAVLVDCIFQLPSGIFKRICQFWVLGRFAITTSPSRIWWVVSLLSLVIAPTNLLHQ